MTEFRDGSGTIPAPAIDSVVQGPRLISSVIAGTGFDVPEKVLTNRDLEKIVDTSDEWITTRTGMKERRVAAEGQAASDYALRAAHDALADANLAAADIDLIIVATVTGDQPLPATACILQQKLGAHNAAAFDLQAGCTGFIYALTTARQFVATGAYRHVLVVGVEVLSRILDWTDRSTCVLFGDGAGAAVLSASDEPDRGVIAGLLGSDGAGADDLMIPGGGSKNPTTVDTVRKALHTVKMNGNAIFKTAVRVMGRTVKRLLKAARIGLDDVKLMIPHQANRRIIEAIAKQLRFPMDRVFVNIEKYGNTSSASTIIAMHEARRAGLIQPGDNILLVAFGAGLTWGGNIIRW